MTRSAARYLEGQPRRREFFSFVINCVVMGGHWQWTGVAQMGLRSTRTIQIQYNTIQVQIQNMWTSVIVNLRYKTSTKSQLVHNKARTHILQIQIHSRCDCEAHIQPFHPILPQAPDCCTEHTILLVHRKCVVRTNMETHAWCSEHTNMSVHMWVECTQTQYTDKQTYSYTSEHTQLPLFLSCSISWLFSILSKLLWCRKISVVRLF